MLWSVRAAVVGRRAWPHIFRNSFEFLQETFRGACDSYSRLGPSWGRLSHDRIQHLLQLEDRKPKGTSMSSRISRLREAKRRGESGFTLIELLVVIIILGILSAVVVFAVRGTGDKGKAAAYATDAKTV